MSFSELPFDRLLKDYESTLFFKLCPYFLQDCFAKINFIDRAWLSFNILHKKKTIPPNKTLQEHL